MPAIGAAGAVAAVSAKVPAVANFSVAPWLTVTRDRSGVTTPFPAVPDTFRMPAWTAMVCVPPASSALPSPASDRTWSSPPLTTTAPVKPGFDPEITMRPGWM